MTRRARITAGEVSLDVELRETPTAEALWAAMPFTSTASTWGDEVYFATPVRGEQEPDAKELLDEGDIAFWLGGDAIAICFGPTPISAPGEMRLISPGNVWATALDDPKVLAAVAGGDPVTVERLEDAT